jgi:hypothetical protein
VINECSNLTKRKWKASKDVANRTRMVSVYLNLLVDSNNMNKEIGPVIISKWLEMQGLRCKSGSDIRVSGGY